jgi:hypothetical protein
VREPKKPKAVGKTIPLADSKGREGRPVGSEPRGEPTPSAGTGNVASNDERNVEGQHDTGGVLQRPELLEQIPVQPGDAVKQRGTRPGVIRAKAYEHKTQGFTLFRYRFARAKTSLENGLVRQTEISVPFKTAEEMMLRMETQKKWGKLVLESLEDFEAIMGNPDWLIKDKADKVEMLLGTLHARLTNLQKNLE